MSRAPTARGRVPPCAGRVVYDATVRRIAIACVVLAGSGARATAQVPAPTADPGAPDPAAADPAGAPASSAPAAPRPPEPPPAAVPRSSLRATQAALHQRALAEKQCALRDPSCDWIGTLSSLERASVERALNARGYEIDAAPWDKVIDAVRVYNEEVFAEDNKFLQFFNYFHVTTRSRRSARRPSSPPVSAGTSSGSRRPPAGCATRCGARSSR
jgi:DNA-binding helix-hairpin-helix protein with protein kinase domain